MDPRTSSTGITLATYVYLLHRQGQPAADPSVAAACAAVDAGGDAAAAASNVERAVSARIQGEGPDAVIAGLRAVLGDEGVFADFAGDGTAAERLAALGRATFGDSRPWLAWIADRRDGRLGEFLALVERVADVVVLMDPNPWDDVAEEREMPLAEFGVRWDLAGGRCVKVR